MYRRYSQVNENAVPVSQVRRNRMKNIPILLLIAALVAVTVVSVPALRSRNAMRELYIRRMQVEISDAAKQTTSLSRSAGADSSAILARIRSNVYAIRMINEMSIGQEGAAGRLLQEETLSTLQSFIDNYLAFLTTGMDTGEYQTNLQNDLNALQITINALQ